jgi:hypothetical protein
MPRPAPAAHTNHEMLDLWRLPPTDYVMGALVAWTVYALTMLFFPRHMAHGAAVVGKRYVDRPPVWAGGISVKTGEK